VPFALLEMTGARKKSEVRAQEVLNIVTSVFIYGYKHERET
jgi:hypothetical protein